MRKWRSEERILEAQYSLLFVGNLRLKNMALGNWTQVEFIKLLMVE